MHRMWRCSMTDHKISPIAMIVLALLLAGAGFIAGVFASRRPDDGMGRAREVEERISLLTRELEQTRACRSCPAIPGSAPGIASQAPARLDPSAAPLKERLAAFREWLMSDRSEDPWQVW